MAALCMKSYSTKPLTDACKWQDPKETIAPVENASIQYNSTQHTLVTSINIWYFFQNPNSPQKLKWGSVRTVRAMWFGGMSNSWACLLRGKDLAGGRLTLSAGSAAFCNTDCKKKHQVGDILELVEKIRFFCCNLPHCQRHRRVLIQQF